MSEFESEEQLARELADELRRLKIEDVLVQTLITISSLGYRRLGLTRKRRTTATSSRRSSRSTRWPR